MALQSSGQISLNDIHVELGESSGSGRNDVGSIGSVGHSHSDNTGGDCDSQSEAGAAGDRDIDSQTETNADAEIENEFADPPDEEVDDDGLVLPKRKKKEVAPVWTVATKTKEGAKCNICGKIYSMPQENTSNIMAHVKLKHK